MGTIKKEEWTESLIKQLPKEHDGRNSWLFNYGKSSEAREIKIKYIIKNVNYTDKERIEKIIEIFGEEDKRDSN